MKIRKYNKLIRDNIPEITRSTGGIPKVHIAWEKEFQEKLKEKLFEEIDEFFEERNVWEMADIFEVLYVLWKEYKIDFAEVEEVRKKKLEKVGGFEKKIILEEVHWGDYKN